MTGTQVPGVDVRLEFGATRLVGDEIRRSVAARIVVLVVATATAFHYTIGSLLASLGADSPLAYLGLVPLIAMPIAYVSARPRPGEPDLHDRHLDWIVGLPAIVVPLAALVVLPAQMSTFFWVWRIDVLLVPVFVAGAVALLFGVRTLYRIRMVVLFLLLAWPVPSRAALSLGLDHFTSWTVAAVTKATAVVPVAHALPNTEGAFAVYGPAGRFTVLVASACSGVNGLVGFLLVAGATLLVVRGGRLRKAAWLTLGATLVWAMNVVRILVVFGVGKFWGEDLAIGVFHPFVGLITFGLAVLVMVLLASRFGLRFGAGAGAGDADRPTLGLAATRAVPRIGRASLLIVAVALVAGHLDGNLREVNPVASALGQPRIATFEQTAHVAGFDRAEIDHFGWATRFFGDDSDWTRFQFSGTGTDTLRSQIPVFADVVTTSNLQSFEDYDVEACYRFHGFGIGGVDRVDLGHGQVGSVLSWRDPDSPIEWLSLYWFLPVVDAAGQERYQRVVLLLDVSSAGHVEAPDAVGDTTAEVGIAIGDAMDVRTDVDPGSPRDAELRTFLVSFGRELVAVAAAEGSGE